MRKIQEFPSEGDFLQTLIVRSWDEGKKCGIYLQLLILVGSKYPNTAIQRNKLQGKTF